MHFPLQVSSSLKVPKFLLATALQRKLILSHHFGSRWQGAIATHCA